ncbi:hypothetical protein ACK08B_11345 [Pantoea dispersa]|uniref:hypothetical protein n=1 Tax=Pantoea dispersa TaxID=59814 RepID=UPI003989B0D6
MHQTLLVVVLSGKTYKDSTTLNCLMSKSYANVELIIINIGPDALRFDKDFIHTLGFYVKSIDIKEYLDARPLSGIFNEIINEHREVERIVLLDDGCYLSKDYIYNLDKFHTGEIDLQVPHIRSKIDGKIYYPIIDETVANVANGLVLNPTQNIHSLGFGLVVYRSAITKLLETRKKIFDDDFSFYDVDCVFFERIILLKDNNLNIKIQVVNTLGHVLNSSSGKDSKWRVISRLKEGFLLIKSYFTS